MRYWGECAAWWLTWEQPDRRKTVCCAICDVDKCAFKFMLDVLSSRGCLQLINRLFCIFNGKHQSVAPNSKLTTLFVVTQINTSCLWCFHFLKSLFPVLYVFSAFSCASVSQGTDCIWPEAERQRPAGCPGSVQPRHSWPGPVYSKTVPLTLQPQPSCKKTTVWLAEILQQASQWWNFNRK